MTLIHYILNGTKPVLCNDIITWAKWFEQADRQVAVDEFSGIRISTVFLGIDHRFSGRGPPLLFETIIFGGPNDQDLYRYSTWKEAFAGHKKLVDEWEAKQ